MSTAAAVRWSNLNYLRHAIVLVAWVAALKAFSLLYQQRLIDVNERPGDCY